ncbi:hypothetical protein PIB30_116853 [Stylosanthes scabra]|uniref:Reverse transcriptase zinc-binding domain-containing protein n=1 Tax=Stylosanthes scabra TaxID=79078 RepID=A0ABU6WTL5_9FABA|nr:hypothetical protein [Stylosanthes scabra]
MWLLEQKIRINRNCNFLWIWRANISKMVTFLIWLAINESLPTSVFRHRSGLAASDLCPLCGEESETVTHCLLNCSRARDFWSIFSPSLSLPVSDLASWVRFALRYAEAVTAAGLWWQWRFRNQLIFNQDEVWSLSKVVFWARGMVHDIEACLCRSPFLRSPINCLTWSKPPIGLHKVNCDASFFQNSNRAGFGCVIRDEEGAWLKGCSGQLPPGLSAAVRSLPSGEVLCWRENVVCNQSFVKQILGKLSLLSSAFVKVWKMLMKI